MPGDNNNLKISVVILAYNEEKNIKKCIDSLLDQTYKPHEIIVINDGSTDKTLKILKDYKKIKIIDKNKNEGRKNGYHDGFYASKGDFIAYLDGDSYAPKNWLKTTIKKIKENKGKIGCIGGYYKSYNTKYLIARLENDYNNLAVSIEKFKFPSGTNMIYNRKICEKTKAFQNLPEFRCDRYPMDHLLKQNKIVKFIPTYVFSKAPHTLKNYLKQRFRWGRGAPSANLIKTSVLLQKIIITLLPFAIITWSIIYSHKLLIPLSIGILIYLLTALTIAIKLRIGFIKVMELIILKIMGFYAHATGYLFESMRKMM